MEGREVVAVEIEDLEVGEERKITDVLQAGQIAVVQV